MTLLAKGLSEERTKCYLVGKDTVLAVVPYMRR